MTTSHGLTWIKPTDTLARFLFFLIPLSGKERVSADSKPSFVSVREKRRRDLRSDTAGLGQETRTESGRLLM